MLTIKLVLMMHRKRIVCLLGLLENHCPSFSHVFPEPSSSLIKARVMSLFLEHVICMHLHIQKVDGSLDWGGGGDEHVLALKYRFFCKTHTFMTCCQFGPLYFYKLIVIHMKICFCVPC